MSPRVEGLEIRRAGTRLRYVGAPPEIRRRGAVAKTCEAGETRAVVLHSVLGSTHRSCTTKNRFLLLRVGYRYLHSFTGDPDEHRAVLEATARYPLVGGVLVSDRGRVDLGFIDGEYSWRFRSRLSVEKEFSIGRVRMNPFLAA